MKKVQRKDTKLRQIDLMSEKHILLTDRMLLNSMQFFYYISLLNH